MSTQKTKSKKSTLYTPAEDYDGAGKLAVVTGASSGIGFELAKQFAINGFDLLIVSGSDAIFDAQEELEGFGSRVDAVRADLSTFRGVERFYEAILDTRRPVEAIAINAGVGVNGDFTRTDLEEEIGMINLNVVSTVHLAKLVSKDMKRRGRGKILFTASIASVMPAPFMAVYAATKAFVLSFSEALRSELADSGITVTALMPGPTDTNFFHRARMEDTKAGAGKKDDPADVAEQGYDALMDDRDLIVASSINTKLQGYMAKLMPESMKAARHRQMAEPGSAGNGKAH